MLNRAWNSPRPYPNPAAQNLRARVQSPLEDVWPHEPGPELEPEQVSARTREPQVEELEQARPRLACASCRPRSETSDDAGQSNHVRLPGNLAKKLFLRQLVHFIRIHP